MMTWRDIFPPSILPSSTAFFHSSYPFFEGDFRCQKPIFHCHQLKYGKPCLALDLMEEFRPIIADSVVITLINNRRIKLEDFTQSHGGWYLKEHRRKVFYAAYETRKNETITHPLFKYKLTFRRAIELQVRLLAKYLTGEIDKYTPLTIR